MSRRIGWLVGLIALALLFWRFPAFRVTGLQDAARDGAVGFDARAFAAEFWKTNLLRNANDATDVSELVAALEKDTKHARARYGHSPGMTSTTFFFVKGSGEVLEVNEEGARVRISPGAHEAEALLHTGLLFGNALRDGSGLIDPGQFPNSQHFNDIATELNRLAETNVLPLLRKIAVPGKKLSFIGCAELEEDETPHPLKIVPVRVE
jgi:predicted lipoprotein